MLTIAGSASLSFLFPADRVTTYNYYRDMNRLVSHLKHIEIADTFPDYQYRLYFHSVELATYHFHVYCDVRLDCPPGYHVIRIVSLENLPPIESTSTLNSTTARGFYSSEAFFHDLGNQTRIEYKLRLQTDLPRPLGMRLMPRRAVNGIAKTITNHRIQEIAEHFINSSIAGFNNYRVTV
ncbi:MAG: DUF1997 domain-containing protein [Ardenticatenaceae bacterium]|nr:DUF1997 domain-containing protein [Ardenticatenaceae bacterium]